MRVHTQRYVHIHVCVLVGTAHIIGHERRMLMNVTPDLLPQQHISALFLSLLLSLYGLETRASLCASLVNHVVPCLPYTHYHKNPVLRAMLTILGPFETPPQIPELFLARTSAHTHTHIHPSPYQRQTLESIRSTHTHTHLCDKACPRTAFAQNIFAH